MKVALVHDWLVTYRGGEKVLAALAELFPEAPIYTLFWNPSQMPEAIRQRKIFYPKGLNRWRRFRKLFLPLYPAMIESFDLYDFDLVISTSSCVAKGAISGPQSKSICYIHSPMRYVWDQQAEYLGSIRQIPLVGSMAAMLSTFLRNWDVVSSQRVDAFIANSEFVQSRVKRYYGRDAIVLHPPIDTDRFEPPTNSSAVKSGYWLAAGAFVPYKRFDLAIAACERLNRKLVVAGSGPLESSLRRAAGPNTEFIISPDDQKFIHLLQGAEGLIMPCVEDFGMIAVEAMACGTPVLALNRGGARDFIRPGITGDFIQEQSLDGVCAALQDWSSDRFHQENIVKFAHDFSKQRFQEKFLIYLRQVVGGALG